jgi:hypothetical protein
VEGAARGEVRDFWLVLACPPKKTLLALHSWEYDKLTKVHFYIPEKMARWEKGDKQSPYSKNMLVREQILPSFALALLKVCLHIMSMIRGKFPP